MAGVVGNGVTWDNKKKKSNTIFYSNKIFKLVRKIKNFPTFQGLIHEINLIALGSLKWPNSYFLCAK